MGSLQDALKESSILDKFGVSEKIHPEKTEKHNYQQQRGEKSYSNSNGSRYTGYNNNATVSMRRNNVNNLAEKVVTKIGTGEAIDYDIVKDAEDVIQSLKRDNHNTIDLKTNQIRKFLNYVNVLRNKVDIYCAKNLMATTLSPELTMEVEFLRVNIVYLVGRDTDKSNAVKKFVDKAGLADKIAEIGNNIARFNKFCKFVEALVAFHKFYGGRDR